MTKLKTILFYILICFTSNLLYSQEIPSTIRGNISDENNELVPFVNIWIKNNKINIGTSSDLQGNFNLNLRGVNVADTITFSCIGYNSFYLPIYEIESPNNLKIILPQKTENLNEFVVTGKKTSVYDIIKNYNKNREKYMPKSTVEYEIFLRQFVKTCDGNSNKYVAMAETVFKILLKNKEYIDSDYLYGNIIAKSITNKDCYELDHVPSDELEALWTTPKIPTDVEYKIDSIIPLDNGFIYVISSINNPLPILNRQREFIFDEDTIIFCKTNEKDVERINSKQNIPSRTYYITNEYKLIKYVRKSSGLESYAKYTNYSFRSISRFREVDFQEFDNIIYPIKMKVVWIRRHNNTKNEFCLIKKDIAEYYMKKMEKVNISQYSNNNKLTVLYKMPNTNNESEYEDYIIYDSIRQIAVEKLKNK